MTMGWLRLVDSLKLQVSFAEDSLIYRALLPYSFKEPTNRSHPIGKRIYLLLRLKRKPYVSQDSREI